MPEITEIVVMVNTRATDRVYVHTTLPSPFPPEVSNDPLTLQFEITAGHGVEYVLLYFPDCPVRKLDMSTGRSKQVR